MRRILLLFVILAMAALACNLPATDTPSAQPTETPDTKPSEDQQDTQSPAGLRPTELSPEQIDRITQAAVQIFAMQRISDREPLWAGSGTIISPDGEIVTNCHVACGAPVIVILMTTTPDLPPEARYIAEVTHYDEDLDLAILRVTTDMDGNPVSPTDLPYLEIGDSDTLRLGDPTRIFGYPGVGGETITFTSGSVSGFESAEINDQTQRVIVKTDADIASGNSGGTAVDLWGQLIGIPTWVNPDIREGVTLGGIGVLRPVNLIKVVRSEGAGTPPPLDSASLPPSEDPDPYEPNDTYDTATGPLAPGDTIVAYISWEGDLDAFYFTTATTQTITVSLTDIPTGTDYDLYLLDESEVLAYSENETGEEFIAYSPAALGTYWIVVNGYEGSSTSLPYTLTVNYDGGSASGKSSENTTSIIGQAISGNTGKPLAGGTFGLLLPGVTCDEFFSASGRDMSVVLVSDETNAKGFFELLGVPTDAIYAAFFIFGAQYACENNWLEIPPGITTFDLGQIEMSFD